jgi:AraC-like DNA-binding protein
VDRSQTQTVAFASLSTHDVEQARAAMSRGCYAARLTPRSPSARLGARLSTLTLGAVSLGDMQFGTDVAVSYGELGAYHVDVLMSGQLTWRQGRAPQRISTPARAPVFQPHGDTTLDRWTGNCRLLGVKIDRQVLEATLGALLDRPIRSPVVLGPDLDTLGGRGRSFARLVRMLAGDLTNPDGLVRQPIMAARLQEAIIVGLLAAADHMYRQALAEPARRLTPRVVKRTVDAIQARPEHPFTCAELAGIAGVSVRALQDSYRHYLGVPPMTYLRRVRLHRVHEDLRRADSQRTTVAEVASRWGFTHLGRFAAQYREAFGTSPSQTLRGG